MTVPANPANYRPDIDGLRSIAVLSVVFYHFEMTAFAGGFVGVDVFFVISGYLITRLIVHEYDRTGRFRFGNFYLRRIRRLFPAMFVTILACIVLAVLLFSATHLERFAGAVISATFSLSNFYFWSEAGYFDSEATVKPLLHTWSLSVEEQFYVIWPGLLVLLMALSRRLALNVTVPAFIVMGALSLWANYGFYDGVITAFPVPGAVAQAIEDGPSTVFFLMPFRIFEFVLGGIVVWLERGARPGLLVRQVLFALGLALIMASIFLFDSKMPFPLHNALIPCIGTSLILYSAVTEGIGRVLNNPVAIWIGLVSYSAYLVHWPLFVFYTYYTFDSLSLVEQGALTALTLGLAGLMYRYIEQPFRHADSALYARLAPRRVALAGGVVVALILAISAHAMLSGGWKGRLPHQEIAAPYDMPYRDGDVAAVWAPENALGKISQQGASLADGNRRGIIIGDSHAGHLRWLAEYVGSRHDITFMRWSQPGCPPVFGAYKIFNNPRFANRQEPCKETIDTWEAYATDPANQVDFVILAARWAWMFEGPEYGPYTIRQDFLIDRAGEEILTRDASRAAFTKQMRATVRRLQEAGITPVLVSQAPNHGKVLDGCQIPTYLVSPERMSARCTGVSQDLVRARMAWIDAEITAIGEETGAPYLVQTEIFCEPGAAHCKSTYGDLLLSNDGSHLNKFGSLYLAQAWERLETFPFARK